jgi:hypothetical protein
MGDGGGEQVRQNSGKAWHKLVAGGCAGAVSRTLTAPLERVKLVLQVQQVQMAGGEAVAAPSATARPFRGVLDALRRLTIEQGVRSLWRGNGINCLRIVPNSGIKLASYSELKAIAFPNGEAAYSGREKHMRKMLCGALSGVTTIVPIYPMDLLRTRLAADGSGRGLTQLLRTTLRTEGVQGLYRGLPVSIGGITLYLSLSLSCYDLLKDVTASHAFFQNPFGKVLLGSVAAVLSQSVAYPVDTVRRCMQVSQERTSTWACVKSIYARGGWRGFYRGLAANTARAAPQTGLEFMAFDIFSSLLTAVDDAEIQDGKRRVPRFDSDMLPLPPPLPPGGVAARLAGTRAAAPAASTPAPASGSAPAPAPAPASAPAPAPAAGAPELVSVAAKAMERRFSLRLAPDEDARVNKLFAHLRSKYRVDDAVQAGQGIPVAELAPVLAELGYEHHEVEEACAAGTVLSYGEFRRLCADGRLVRILEELNGNL